jgi:hypothetical protein
MGCTFFFTIALSENALSHSLHSEGLFMSQCSIALSDTTIQRIWNATLELVGGR